SARRSLRATMSLNASAILPWIPVKSAGRRTLKSPSRKSTMAVSSARENGSVAVGTPERIASSAPGGGGEGGLLKGVSVGSMPGSENERPGGGPSPCSVVSLSCRAESADGNPPFVARANDFSDGTRKSRRQCPGPPGCYDEASRLRGGPGCGRSVASGRPAGGGFRPGKSGPGRGIFPGKNEAPGEFDGLLL